MNKVRIIGVLLLLGGVLTLIFFDTSFLDLFAGLLTGAGLGFVHRKNPEKEVTRFRACKKLLVFCNFFFF